MNLQKIRDFVNRLGYEKVRKEIGIFVNDKEIASEHQHVLDDIIKERDYTDQGKIYVFVSMLSLMKDVPIVYFER